MFFFKKALLYDIKKFHIILILNIKLETYHYFCYDKFVFQVLWLLLCVFV